MSGLKRSKRRGKEREATEGYETNGKLRKEAS